MSAMSNQVSSGSYKDSVKHLRARYTIETKPTVCLPWKAATLFYTGEVSWQYSTPKPSILLDVL